MLRLVLILACCAGLPVLAQSDMSAEEFDRYTLGKTLFYGQGGQAYGVERYLPDRRVIWSFLDGDCKQGLWYEREDGQICFLYEDRLDPQCWSFSQGTQGLIARFENDPQATELYEAEDIGEEMLCYGPDVGV
ncbi:hypothetical protein [Ruegeria hyattellae]|uniref:hypothetical protein n=1 Tax=Ruegeria hyattellae TaxID=3233337 RepID=UPI00355B5243